MAEQKYKYDNHPRDSVRWNQAVAFCRWLTAKLPRDAWPSGDIPIGEDWVIRLPTEWEWQQAATGGLQEREYPWGEGWDSAHCNTVASRLNQTTAVGVYPQGVSPVGALDMAGNLWEWCLNEYLRAKNVGLGGDAARSVRGGSFVSNRLSAACAFRNLSLPYLVDVSVGFRVVLAAPLSSYGRVSPVK